jgi:alpha-tubulin suppressor-like RCC1 family protein
MGSNSHGQLGIGEQPTPSGNKFSPILIESLMDVDPYQIECGFNHCLLLSRDGVVFAWGDNKHGQCGIGMDI